MFKPTVGRIVHFYNESLAHHDNNGLGRGPYAAMILQVFGAPMTLTDNPHVNLHVFAFPDDFKEGSVRQRGDEDDGHPADSRYYVEPPRVEPPMLARPSWGAPPPPVGYAARGAKPVPMGGTLLTEEQVKEEARKRDANGTQDQAGGLQQNRTFPQPGPFTAPPQPEFVTEESVKQSGPFGETQTVTTTDQPTPGADGAQANKSE